MFNPNEPRDKNGQWTDAGEAIRAAASDSAFKTNEVPSEKDLKKVYVYQSEIAKAKRLFGLTETVTDTDKNHLRLIINEFKEKVNIAKQSLVDLSDNNSDFANKEKAKLREYIRLTSHGLKMHGIK